MSRLDEFIARRHEAIVACWLSEARRSAAANGLNGPELHNLMPRYVATLGRPREQAGPRPSEEQQRLLENHLGNRLREGFDLSEILDEFALVARCIATVAAGDPESNIAPADMLRLTEEFHGASAEITRMVTRHLLDDEQRQKRYARRLQQLAASALAADSAPLRARLPEVVALVREAMDASVATLFLRDAATGELVLSASAGVGHEAVERYVTGAGARSFAARIAAREGETTGLPDVETTELEVSPALRSSGIHSLLGVRLPAWHTLRGVMYVGIRERRRFNASEIRRLETLGEQLTLHLDGARLFAELLERIDDLRVERELRERFVDALVHDLRGPLTTARLGVEMLPERPPEELRRAAGKIVDALGRADRMITDLLDAHRIRAGERLPLRLQEVDLVELARQVIAELGAGDGPRFVLRGDHQVRGTWSAADLRRALWNLATNAAKYGAPDAPIEITVENDGDGAILSVHNDGNEIPAEQQARLFEPFSRGRAGLKGRVHGWGLGLTFVLGAAEAHGGHVDVRSAPGQGTTFTLRIPSLAPRAETRDGAARQDV